jgi:hypothetical protein
MSDYTVENQTHTWRLHNIIRDIDIFLRDIVWETDTPGLMEIIKAKNHLIAAKLEIENS